MFSAEPVGLRRVRVPRFQLGCAFFPPCSVGVPDISVGALACSAGLMLGRRPVSGLRGLSSGPFSPGLFQGCCECPVLSALSALGFAVLHGLYLQLWVAVL